MTLLFQIQDLQLLIFCMDDQEFVANLDYIFLCFLLQHHQSYSFFELFYAIVKFSFFSFLYIKFFLIPYAYASTESIDRILLSSFELKAILLISSVKILCLSLLNLCLCF